MAVRCAGRRGSRCRTARRTATARVGRGAAAGASRAHPAARRAQRRLQPRAGHPAGLPRHPAGGRARPDVPPRRARGRSGLARRRPRRARSAAGQRPAPGPGLPPTAVRGSRRAGRGAGDRGRRQRLAVRRRGAAATGAPRGRTRVGPASVQLLSRSGGSGCVGSTVVGELAVAGGTVGRDDVTIGTVGVRCVGTDIADISPAGNRRALGGPVVGACAPCVTAVRPACAGADGPVALRACAAAGGPVALRVCAPAGGAVARCVCVPGDEPSTGASRHGRRSHPGPLVQLDAPHRGTAGRRRPPHHPHRVPGRPGRVDPAVRGAGRPPPGRDAPAPGRRGHRLPDPDHTRRPRTARPRGTPATGSPRSRPGVRRRTARAVEAGRSGHVRAGRCTRGPRSEQPAHARGAPARPPHGSGERAAGRPDARACCLVGPPGRAAEPRVPVGRSRSALRRTTALGERGSGASRLGTAPAGPSTSRASLDGTTLVRTGTCRDRLRRPEPCASVHGSARLTVDTTGAARDGTTPVRRRTGPRSRVAGRHGPTRRGRAARGRRSDERHGTGPAPTLPRRTRPAVLRSTIDRRPASGRPRRSVRRA